MIWFWRLLCLVGLLFFAVPMVYLAVIGDLLAAIGQAAMVAGVVCIWSYVKEKRQKAL